MTDLLGQVIAHYRLDALIGEGGMGTVYKAHDQNLERTVAVKVMHAHYARRAEFRARLTQEAKTAAQLGHPSIVGIYDFGQYNDGLYIAMEYIGGGSLRAHLHRLQSRNQFLPLKQSFQIGVQIADALDYAHRQGVVHRDVKPSNIILKRLNRPEDTTSQPFRAVLTDFGLVKLLEGDSMTQSGTTLGTPTYMSPEQCEGLVMDGRSDLYSLGVVLYELLTNRLPFAFKSLSEAVGTHMRGELPARPTEFRPGLPPIVDTLLMRCLAKSTDERFATGLEMADALEAAIFSLEGAPTQTLERPKEINQRQSLSALISGSYWLQIETPGKNSSHTTLTRGSVTIGRNADNVIVLPAEGVSRYHARIEATESGWKISDLGGINGTWLNEQRLRPGVSLDYTTGDMLEIGPYQIILNRLTDDGASASLAAAATVARRLESPESETRSAANITEAQTAEFAEQPLSIYIARDTFVVEPGRNSELKVDVVNRSNVADRVSLRVVGLPNQWVEGPDSFVRVNPGQSVTIPIQIRPPRVTNTPAGRQRFRIEVKSQQYPGMELAAGATLNLGSYEAFEMAMEPKQISLPALVRVTIRNTGNANAEFSVIGSDPAEEIHFRGERGRIRLEPRQTAAVDLELEAKHRAWFGKSEVYPFRVDVTTASGANQSARGRATISSLLPAALIYIVMFLAIFLCVVAALLFVFQRDRLGTLPPATGSEIESIAMTSTAAISGSATSAVIATSDAATAAAATAQIIGDRDNDGLSDAQEGIIGTDPDNPDTDSDGLLDGEEVLTWGTEPLIRDTDTDILLDGDEVRTYGTSPTNPDTDGDGIPDGIEVASGTDPLNPFDPPASPTPVLTPPTAISTETAIPSATPISTPSSTPTVPPTNTPTITSSPTSTPSATPSQTPTITPTLTSTAQPTPLADCSLEAPVLDGIVTEAEWGSDPAFTFAPDEDPTRLVKGYIRWVTDQLYLAYEINDPSVDQKIDSLRVYFDASNNAGDPDSSDRFFQIVRDNTLMARTGINTNIDGLYWKTEYESQEWNAVVAESGVDSWSIELEIDATNELPTLLAGNPFALMTLVQYSGSLGIWPEAAKSDDAGTWQVVENNMCP